jgi:hypothetical protein
MAWKDVLRVTDATDPTMRRSFPEIEAKLKLLYTAITRCQHKLLFIETKKSVAAASFFRWLTDKKLGEVRDRRCGKQASSALTFVRSVAHGRPGLVHLYGALVSARGQSGMPAPFFCCMTSLPEALYVLSTW